MIAKKKTVSCNYIQQGSCLFWAGVILKGSTSEIFPILRQAAVMEPLFIKMLETGQQIYRKTFLVDYSKFSEQLLWVESVNDCLWGWLIPIVFKKWVTDMYW